MGYSKAYAKGWKAKRRQVLDRDGWECFYCHCDLRAPGVIATVDHVIAVADLEAMGYSSDPSAVHVDDLVSACGSCNSRRGAQMKGRRRKADQVAQARRPSPLLEGSVSGSPWGAPPRPTDVGLVTLDDLREPS